MDALNSSFQSAVGTAISASALQSGQIKSSDFQPRNYSDFIRSLAAKYNNSNPNEYENYFTFYSFFFLFVSSFSTLH